MDFDTPIDRRGTGCAKWDAMETAFGVSPDDGLAMWVADMDFAAPDPVRDALHAMADHGVFGYLGRDAPYREAIAWWMAERHGWQIDTAAIFSTHGLVNGTAMCIDIWTEPGDGVVLFTPVYHAFHRIIRAAGRTIVECPLVLRDGRYEMDFAAYDAMMTGSERMVILCSPHNPGGRVWSRQELQGVADFAERHDLILVADEIHHDLVFPDFTHTPMAVAVPQIADRLVMLTAASKTFNIAGAHVGNVIIHDAALRKAFAGRMAALGMSPNTPGVHMATAAYSTAGAAWVDALMGYLDANCTIFDAGVSAIPGVRPMELEGTYLGWVDFSGTGMDPQEVTRRVQEDAKIAANHGSTFGKGGESFLRFNIAMPQAGIEEAVARLQRAFADLQ